MHRIILLIIPLAFLFDCVAQRQSAPNESTLPGDTNPPPETTCPATDPDLDGDGVCNSNDPDDDDDGLPDDTEEGRCTSPVLADTDGDGFDDGCEDRQGTDPCDSSVYPDTCDDPLPPP